MKLKEMIDFRARVMIFVTALSFGCVFHTEETPFELSLSEDASKPVSLFPTLHFVASVPLIDSSFGLSLIPDPGAVYHSRLNEYGDTLILEVTGMLAPETEYHIRPLQALHASSGAVLRPPHIIATITTGFSEREPNNGIKTADTLHNELSAIISTANDTDFYIIAHDSAAALVCHSRDTKCIVSLFGSEGDSLMTPFTESGIDTLVMPQTYAPPLRVKAYSHFGIAGARYSLHVISRAFVN